MSVDKNKVIEYYLKGQNKVEDGVYTENILSGDLSKLSMSMIKSAVKNGEEMGAEKVNICLCNMYEYAKLRKKNYPDAEGVVAVRLKGKTFENINNDLIQEYVKRFEDRVSSLPRKHGLSKDVVILANEEGLKAVEVTEANEKIAENSMDITTKSILKENYNDIPRDETYIAFCNAAFEEMGMER